MLGLANTRKWSFPVKKTKKNKHRATLDASETCVSVYYQVILLVNEKLEVNNILIYLRLRHKIASGICLTVKYHNRVTPL